jgi:hypothetical protein
VRLINEIASPGIQVIVYAPVWSEAMIELDRTMEVPGARLMSRAESLQEVDARNDGLLDEDVAADEATYDAE